MIYPAEIINVDYNSHTCQVNIPDLTGVNDSPNASGQMAHILETPGISNAYKKGDIVWVSFIKGAKQYPIVLGFVTAQTTCDGALISKTLEVSGNAKIPRDTMIIDAENDYNSFTKIINKLKETTNFMGNTDHKQASTPVAADYWANITVVVEESKFDSDFPVGKVLFVRNTSGKSHLLNSFVDIFPNYSTCGASNTLIEFTSSVLNLHFNKLPGVWKLIALFDGGFLAQRCIDTIAYTDTAVTVVGDGTYQYTCELYDAAGSALSWYWEFDENGYYLKPVRSRDLYFYTTKNDNVTLQLITDSTKTQIFNISIENEQTPGTFDTLLNYYNDPQDPINRIIKLAVLNLRQKIDSDNLTGRLLNKNNKPCRFESNYTQNSIFKSSVSPFGIEYIYLPDEYNKTYLGMSEIPIAQFMGASRLSKLLIPEQTGRIMDKAFSGTGESFNRSESVKILNIENSLVHYIGTEAFKNIRLENNTIKLPKHPYTDCISFAQGAISAQNWPANVPYITTIIAHTALNFDYSYDFTNNCISTTKHNGAFNYGGYINKYTKELIFPVANNQAIQSRHVHNLLQNSSLLSFFKTTAVEVTTDHVEEILNNFKTNVVDAANTGAYPADIILTTADNALSVRFIDWKNRSNITGYTLGKPEIPTIIFNY